jgi:CHASE3 domain sensor protein
MQIEVAQSVIAIAGGFENFADITSSFVDNFFTDAEKLAMLEGSVTEAFNSLGQAAVTSREEFRKLVGGVDLTTVAGQELFAALLELNPALSEFIDGIEDAARDAFSMLEKAVSLERQRARAVLDVAGEAHKAEIGRIRELRSTLTSLDPSGFSSASELAVQTALNQNRLAQLDMLEESADAVFDLHKQGYADELSRLDQLIEDNESLLNAALGIDDSVLSVESAIAALNETIAALAPTSGGALPQTAGRATGDALREQTKDEVKKMREENAMFQREIVKNTKTTARLLQRMELNGIDTNAV